MTTPNPDNAAENEAAATAEEINAAIEAKTFRLIVEEQHTLTTSPATEKVIHTAAKKAARANQPTPHTTKDFSVMGDLGAGTNLSRRSEQAKATYMKRHFSSAVNTTPTDPKDSSE